jgi:hypothetical protein
MICSKTSTTQVVHPLFFTATTKREKLKFSGSYTQRRAETNFKQEHYRRMADEWIAWEASQQGVHIRHQLNNTEKRIGARRIPVDWFHSESQTVFQLHGNFDLKRIGFVFL